MIPSGLDFTAENAALQIADEIDRERARILGVVGPRPLGPMAAGLTGGPSGMTGPSPLRPWPDYRGNTGAIG